MMIRVLGMSYVALIAGLMFGSYHVSYQTDQLSDQRAEVERAIAAERRHIELLEAEWEARTAPDNLARLTRKFLPELSPAAPERLVRLSDVPLRRDPAMEQPGSMDELLTIVEDGEEAGGNSPVF